MNDNNAGHSDLVLLSEYKAPDWVIEDRTLEFDLDPKRSRVTATYRVKRLNNAKDPLWFDGENIELEGIKINGEKCSSNRYRVSNRGLSLDFDLEAGEVEITSFCAPDQNVDLEGLYISDGVFSTQCEAEGFRRICYAPDRPDQLSVYKVAIRADKEKYPYLLSNGNMLSTRDLPDGRHEAVWEDPWRKPSYLFALVAGDFQVLRDEFITASGRKVALAIYVVRDIEKASWAMEALKKSMRWDEERMQREYDLDVFNVVAVPDFNFGAMENKGLNIFNDRLIMADPSQSTDRDFMLVESVVAHEYFHNWTGNRITCRDWFQLCLKEGLTVFRDQEFTSDTRNRSVKRIEDIVSLKARQHSEDMGPLAHPVRPREYRKINNFYTATVYDKGAEVIRMLMTILGREEFDRCLQVYFDKFDGTAATIEEFFSCFKDALVACTKVEAFHFMHWWNLAGTPKLTCKLVNLEGKATLQVRQTLRNKSGKEGSAEFLMPFHFAVIDGNNGAILDKRDAIIHASNTSFVLSDRVKDCSDPVLSINRGFVAPVSVSADSSPAVVARWETSLESRWDAMQELYSDSTLTKNDKARAQAETQLTQAIASIMRSDAPYSAKASLITPPTTSWLMQRQDRVDPAFMTERRLALFDNLANALKDDWSNWYGEINLLGADNMDDAATGARGLRNLCLLFLDSLDLNHALKHEREAQSFTERLGALGLLSHYKDEKAHAVLLGFGEEARPALLRDYYHGLRSSSRRGDALAYVEETLASKDFDLRNPNRVYALLFPFVQNLTEFHKLDGSGYRLLERMIVQRDKENQMVSSYLAKAFSRWQQYAEPWSSMQRDVLQNLTKRDCSDQLSEILSLSL